MSAGKTIQRAAKRLGLQVQRYHPHKDPYRQLVKICSDHNCGALIDVGANDGEFVASIIEAGYQGPVISVEPLPDAWERLSKRASGHSNWTIARPMALGGAPGRSEINVSKNSVSSSLLDVLAASTNAAPESAYQGKQEIEISTVDDLCKESQLSGAVALKLDVQGYEGHVLDGVQESLPQIEVIMSEMSLTPVYAGAPTFLELYQRIEGMGFRCVGVWPTFTDRVSLRTLQVDAIFERQR